VSRPPERPWWMPAATVLGAAFVRLLGSTWRIEPASLAAYERALADTGGRCIFAFWHSRLLALAYLHRARGAAVLVSRSRDGEIIAGIVERLGFVTARGSSTRGASSGVAELLEWAARGRALALTPDGPLGPEGTVKPGLVQLASRSGLPVVPVAACASADWIVRSWDRFRVPRPFARVEVGYGAAVRIPGGIGDDEVEAWRGRLEEVLHAHTRAVAARAAEAP